MFGAALDCSVWSEGCKDGVRDGPTLSRARGQGPGAGGRDEGLYGRQSGRRPGNRHPGARNLVSRHAFPPTRPLPGRGQ